MKGVWLYIKQSVVVALCFTVLLGIVYPYFIFFIGQIFFHTEANGHLIHGKNGRVIGAAMICQNFTEPRYFHPRPSHAGPEGYDAANSSGSNLGPTSQKLSDLIKQRSAAYRLENQLALEAKIPTDAVTASGSGLDPHISIENAFLQVGRIASARQIEQEKINQLIVSHIENPFLGLFGKQRVNVLLLNLALDRAEHTDTTPRISF